MLYNADLCTIEIRQEPEDADTDSDDVYLSAIISSGALDNHGTRMTEKTLKNFARDLKTDIQFKDSHQYGHGFGRSTGGKYEDGKVIGDFTLTKGFALRNASYPTSDEFVRAISKKIITNVSVGFSGGTRTCSICKADWFRRGCYHWPGKSYPVVVNGRETTVRAEVSIDDAHLVEVSAVSRGSNPDAHIVSQAQRGYAEGALPIEVQEQLEQQYEIRFDSTIREDSNMADEKGLQEQLDETRSELAEHKTKMSELEDKVSELEPLAECGREARKATAAEVVNAYKIRQGDSVTAEAIAQVEERNTTLTYIQLRTERDYLKSQAPEKPKVQPGAKVTQPDSSDSRETKP